jgi:hypothetical protein
MIQCLPGIIQYVVGDFAAAVDAFREPIRDFEKSPLPNLMYAVCQACSGHVAEGVHIMDQIAKDMPGRNGDLASFLKHAWLGDKDSALGSITEDLEQAAWWDDIYPLWIADGYALTGEPDRAFHWLEHAIDYGIRNVPFLSQHDPFLENLRSDPRFDALMGKAQRLSDSLGEIQ